MKGNYVKSEHFEITDTIGVPHPYCITARHVTWASDKFGCLLGDDAVESAEKAGITCGMRGCRLSWKEHEQALLVSCYAPLTIDGKNNPELQQMLEDNVKECEANNYAVFAFLDKTGERK